VVFVYIYDPENGYCYCAKEATNWTGIRSPFFIEFLYPKWYLTIPAFIGFAIPILKNRVCDKGYLFTFWRPWLLVLLSIIPENLLFIASTYVLALKKLLHRVFIPKIF
jgi:hypothetical protein